MMRPFVTLFIKNETSIHDAPVIEFSDEDWQSEVLRDMQEASLLVVIPSWPSEALKWELDQIIEHGHLSKTYILMPPCHLVRSKHFARTRFVSRTVQSARYLWHVFVSFISPDQHIISYPPVVNIEERYVHAAIGWHEAASLFAERNLALPEYDDIGGFIHANLLKEEPLPAKVNVLDQRRQLELVGVQPWWNTGGGVLASVARVKT